MPRDAGKIIADRSEARHRGRVHGTYGTGKVTDIWNDDDVRRIAIFSQIFVCPERNRFRDVLFHDGRVFFCGAYPDVLWDILSHRRLVFLFLESMQETFMSTACVDVVVDLHHFAARAVAWFLPHGLRLP